MEFFVVEVPVKMTVKYTIYAPNAEEALKDAISSAEAEYEDNDLLPIRTEDCIVRDEQANMVYPPVVTGV